MGGWLKWGGGRVKRGRDRRLARQLEEVGTNQLWGSIQSFVNGGGAGDAHSRAFLFHLAPLRSVGGDREMAPSRRVVGPKYLSEIFFFRSFLVITISFFELLF